MRESECETERSVVTSMYVLMYDEWQDMLHMCRALVQPCMYFDWSVYQTGYQIGSVTHTCLLSTIATPRPAHQIQP